MAQPESPIAAAPAAAEMEASPDALDRVAEIADAEDGDTSVPRDPREIPMASSARRAPRRSRQP